MIRLLSQCPCSGGGPGGGISQFALFLLLALVLSLWQAAKWTKATWNMEGTTNMLRFGKIGLIVALVAVIVAVVGGQLIAAGDAKDSEGNATAETNSVPKLLDLGSKKCIPCKKMAPILEALKEDYVGKFDVEFIDVGLRENAAASRQYGIKRIPTQIFFDKDGKELWRHEGFLGKDEILAKWKELGVTLERPVAPAAAPRDALPSVQPEKVERPGSTTVDRRYPNLASGALVHAQPVVLPEGIVLRAGLVQVTQADVDAGIAKAPDAMREQLRKNALFVLEQMATQRLLLEEAKAAAAKGGKDVSTLAEEDVLKAYLDTMAADVTVTDAEVAEFYEKNKDMVGGQKLDSIKDAIANFMTQQKQQDTVNEYIRTLGQRTVIEVAAPWLTRQADVAMDNPVDRARASGKPSLVDFGSKGCRPCDMLAPILETMKTKYADKANVVFVSVREEQVLASRYAIRSIPVQIFFDKDGKEVSRHTGFWPQDELEKKLAEVGVK